MRQILVSLLAFTASLLCGCFPLSLNPIYTEQDRLFLPQLMGAWAAEDSQSWTFTAGDSGSYRLELRGDQGEVSLFRAQLARVEGILLLDLFPVGPDEDAVEELTQMHLMKLHSFAVVHQIEPLLKMSFMQQDWLEKYLERHPGSLGSMRRDDRLILTASTSDLQKFVIRQLQTEGAFFEPEELRRMSDED